MSLISLAFNSSVHPSLQQTSLYMQYGFHLCGHPATLSAVQVFYLEDSSEWLQHLHLFLQELITKSVQMDISISTGL